MSTTLENMLKELDELSTGEMLILLENLSRQLRQKNLNENNSPVIRPVEVPGAYQFSTAEIETELAEIFTPQELVEISNTDISSLVTPPGAKTVTEILSEDREDRF